MFCGVDAEPAWDADVPTLLTLVQTQRDWSYDHLESILRECHAIRVNVVEGLKNVDNRVVRRPNETVQPFGLLFEVLFELPESCELSVR